MNDLKTAKKKKLKSNRRKQEKQPRDWRKLFHRGLRVVVTLVSVFLVASGGLLTAQMLLESGYFGVEKIRVENQSRVTEADVLDASDIQLGDSLFELDLFMIGRKIEENPWISKAEVERSFPNQVVIRIEERQPRAIIDLDYLYYVDRQGSVFKMLESGDLLDFPVITGIDRQYLLEEPEKTHQSLELALSLMDQLESRTLFNLDDVSEIHFDERLGLIVYTRTGGVPVRMGYENFSPKLNRLETVFKELEPRLMALKYIDLNVTDRVIVKVDKKRASGRS